MNFINYTPAIILSFIGFFIGIFLAYFVSEEKNIILKYLKIINKSILITIFIITNVILNVPILYIVLSTLLISLIFYYIKINTILISSILGVMIFLSKININLFFINSFLIFSYAITDGTIDTWSNNKKWEYNTKKILIKNISFIIIAVLLFFIF